LQKKPVFELLYEASKAISSEIDLQKVVQRVTDIGTELAGAQFGAFFYNVTNQNGESFVLYTISGVAREAFSKFPMPRNTQIFEPTFTAKGTIRYDDVTQQPHYGHNHPHHGMPKGHLPVKSYLAVPVVSTFTKEAIGGLFFGHSEVGVFTEESEKLIEGVAVQAAIAITNARLFEEKKHSEEKLVEQREQYKSIFHAISDSAIIYNEDGTIVEVNTTACQVYGYRYDELIGLNASRFFNRPEDFTALKDIALSGREYSGTHTRIRKDGSRVEVDFKGVRFMFKDKPHVLSVSRDMTSKKKTDEALEQGEKLSNLITNVSPVTLWMTNNEAATIFINQTWIDWVGGSLDSQLGTGWFNHIVETDRERVKTDFFRAFEQRKQFSNEFRIKRKSGEIRWCLSQGSPYYNKDGSFGGYAGSVSDTTDRKKVEERLSSQNTLINTITNNTLQALFLMNDKQVCTYMNPAAEQMTGFKLHEVQEKPLHYYVHHTHPDGRHFPIEECDIDRALPTKAQTKGEEVFIHKTGTFYPVAFIASPIIENGVPIGTVIEARNTSEEKRIQEELRNKEQQALQMLEDKVKERTRELEQMNLELVQFASVASHDLKEPVRKISVFSKLLRDRLPESLDASSSRYLNTVVSSSERMALLIDDLLAFSRLSNSKVELENVDLNEVVNQVLHDLELPIHEKNATVALHHLPTIKGIPLQLGQVFQNLVSNSLKFSHPQKQLKIDIAVTDATLEGKPAKKIIYRDNGIGFSQDQAEKIFEIFYRLHSKDQYEGTGVGLAIVKKIIDFHKGTILARGKENEGACFEIVLPVKPGEAAAVIAGQ
jgi:PAS domain S-box-containing protein